MANSFPDKASEAATSVKQAAAAGVDDVKSRVADAGSKATDLAETQKNRAAAGLHGVAGIAKDAADNLEPHLPSAAKAVRNVASGVDQASRDLHAQSIEDLGAGITRIAREQPVAALATAFVAGILISRAFSSR